MEIFVDLRDQIGPARDQGMRPTCLAFALSASHEFHCNFEHVFSPEWLYYHGIVRSGDAPDAGLSAQIACEALRLDGQPSERDWPYCMQSPDPASWRPPCVPQELYHAGSDQPALDFNALANLLQSGHPVVLNLLVDDTFMGWDTEGGEAIIRHTPAPYDPDTGHSVLAVGHGKLGGARYVLIRNSWGPSWASAGYAWISEEYISERGFSAIVLRDV